MRKISSYLYPNRIQLLADMAGFSTEYTNVYQRNIKIYNGIDNTLEFDIKNADQKRIDLSTLSNIELNVMDSQGNALPNSPYVVEPLDQLTLKGLAKVVIPQADLADLSAQYLRYSVSAVKDGADVLLYCDSRFGAVGTIELDGSAMPTFRDPIEYNTYTGEIDLMGNVINHFSAMPATFYESTKTTQLSFEVHMTGFIGDIWLEGTRHSTISVGSFKNAEIPNTRHNFSTANSTPYTFTVDVSDYAYFRVSFQGDNPLTPTGKVDKVIAG